MKNSTETKEIRQSNVITASRHELSAVQLDLYFMLLAQLKEDDQFDKIYRIKISEIETLTGRKWNYQQLRIATHDLLRKVFEIPKPKGLLQVAMLSHAEYVDGSGEVELGVSSKLRPYLIDIKTNFTSFHLHNVLAISSKYGKWLYLQCCRWQDIGYIKFDLDDFRVLLNLKDPKGKNPDLYPQIVQLKDRVIEPSIKQINQQTNFYVSYSLEKRGRKFQYISFSIKLKEEVQKLIPFGVKEPDSESILLRRKLNDIGIQNEKIISSVLESSELRKKAHKWFFDFQHQRETIKHPAGHFRTALGI